MDRVAANQGGGKRLAAGGEGNATIGRERPAYLNTFDDVAAGREAAIALIRAGADMFLTMPDAAAIVCVSGGKQSPNAFIFGANEDQRALAPERVLGSAVIDLPRAFLTVAREVHGGTLRQEWSRSASRAGVIRYEPNPALQSGVPAP